MIDYIPLDGLDEPTDYELIGGPFDGSVLRLAVDWLPEMPPKLFTIECDPRQSRGGQRERYAFDCRHEYDENDVPISDTIGFFHEH